LETGPVRYGRGVVHYSRLSDVVIDVPAGDHDSEMAFWSAAAGQEPARLGSHPEYHRIRLAGQDVGLLIQRLADGPARVHLDIHTDDLDAEVSRLEGLGAERIQQVHAWWIMRDPAGLLFCVVPRPPESFDDSNAQRWA
jgi:predicted enzyme related to lactoylglutathione lyase